MRSIGRRGTAVLLGAVALVGLSACDTRPPWDREPVGRRYFDSTGTYVHAGVSARTDVDIEPLHPATLGADTASSSFRLLQMRCAACHDAPDPTMKTARGWSYLIGRMQDKTRTAGVIPMTDAEADSILGFLRHHARLSDPSGRRHPP